MSKELGVGRAVDARAQYYKSNNFVSVYVEDDDYIIWFSKQDLLDMLKLFEEQEQESK